MSQVGIADKHYWLDEEGNVTTDEAKSHIWLVREGSPITKDVADKYGIGKVAQEDAEEVTEDADASPDEEKATKPSANKSKKPTQNKGVK